MTADSVWAEFEQARLLVELGRHDAAREKLGRILATDPDNAFVLAELGALDYRTGAAADAVRHARAAVGVDPDNQYALRVLAIAELRLANGPGERLDGAGFERALAAAQRAVALDPEQPGNLQVLAYVTVGPDPVGALGILERALELDPEDPDLHVDRANVLRVAGRPGAEEAARAALRLHPEHPGALAALSNLALDRGDLAEGKRGLREVARVDPGRAGAVRNALAEIEEAERLERGMSVPAAAAPGPMRTAQYGHGGSGSGGAKWVAAGVVILVLVGMGFGGRGGSEPGPSSPRVPGGYPTVPSHLLRTPYLPPSPLVLPSYRWEQWQRHFPSDRVPPPAPR